MWKLFNASAQKYTTVDDNNLLPALQSGQFRLGAGERVRFFTPDGDEFEGDASTDWKALPADYVIENSQAKQQRELLEEAGNSPIKAGVAGAARGATFGLSDFAGSALGYSKELNALREANPIASTLGEVAGAVGSAVLLPGGGLVGGAGKLGAGATSAAAKAVGADLGAALATGGVMAATKDLTKRSFTRAVGAGVEGALYGAGQTITEASLGDPTEAAENLVSNMGLSALIGGAAGGTFGAFGDMFRKGVSTLTKENAEKAVTAYSNAVQKVRGMKSDEVDDLFKGYLKPENALERKLAADFMKDPDQAKITFWNGLESLKNTSETLGRSISGDLRRDMVENMGQFKKAQQQTIVSEARGVLSAQRNELKELLKGPDRVLYDTGLLAKLDRIRANTVKKIKAADATPGDVYEAMLDYRKQMDSWTKKRFGKTPDMLGGSALTTKEVTDKLRAGTNDFLRNERVFGPVAVTGKKIDGALNEYLTAQSNFFKEFARKKKLPNGMSEYVIDPGKVGSFFNNPEAARNFMKQNSFDDYFKAVDNLTKVTDERGILQGLPEQTKTALAQAQALKKDMTAIRSSVLGLNALQSYTGKSMEYMLWGSILGGSMLGPLAPVAGAAGWALGNPVTMFKVLSKVEDAILNNKAGMASKVSRFVGGLPIAAQPEKSTLRAGSLNALAQMVSQFTPDEKVSKVDPENFENLIYALQQVDPMKVSENVTRSLAPLTDQAPAVSSNASQTAIRAIEYLKFAAPKSSLPTTQFGALQEKYVPTSIEKAKFQRTVEAVMSPIAVLDDLTKGTLTKEHVEAIKAVYPAMYQQLQTTVFNALTDPNAPKKLPYLKKLQLSTLLQLPTMPALDGEFLAMIQTQLAYAEEENQTRMAKAFGKGSPTTSMTATQQGMS